jgi:hypothetical protein
MRLAALLCSLVLLAAGAEALAAKASLNAQVEEKTWKAVRLRGLPKNASLSVRVEASGPIVVILLHESEVKRFPKPVRPAFAGSLERRLSFRVTVPLAGNYYVILDNRKGSEAREVRLLIEALPARRPEKKASPPKPGGPGLDAT